MLLTVIIKINANHCQTVLKTQIDFKSVLYNRKKSLSNEQIVTNLDYNMFEYTYTCSSNNFEAIRM